MSVEDLGHLELCYAPPFGSAKDIVNVAGFTAQNMEKKLVKPIYELSADTPILDVRDATVAEIHPINGT